MALKTDQKVKTIFTNVSNGVGNHSSFLQSFAHAVCAADVENFYILLNPSIILINKYRLDQPQYLENGESK